MTPTSCPFCNALLPALTAPAAGEKLPCPRCGELVPAARWPVTTAIASGEPNVKPPAAELPLAQVPGKRKTALILVSVMFTMAAVGLGFMLWTIKERWRESEAGARPRHV